MSRYAELHERWRELIGEYTPGKMSVRAWCKARGVDEHQFYMWRSRLGMSPAGASEQEQRVAAPERCRSEEAPAGWLAVRGNGSIRAGACGAVAGMPAVREPKAAGSDAGGPSGVGVRIGEALIEVSVGFEASVFLEVVRALEAPRC